MLEKTYIDRGGPAVDLDNRELEELFSLALSNALTDIKNFGACYYPAA